MTKLVVMMDYQKSFMKDFWVMLKFHYWHQICDAIITEEEIYDTLKSMENDKTPGNDEL